MAEPATYTNTCACGWEVSGSADEVVVATIEHGRRIHNMTATPEQVLAALRTPDAAAGRDDEAGDG